MDSRNTASGGPVEPHPDTGGRASRRMTAVEPPIIPTVGDWIRATPGVLSLAQGVVDYPPPRSALDAAAAFLQEDRRHVYGPVEGDPELLEAIATKLVAEDGLDCAARGQRIVVTAGANMGFLNALFAVADPGDEVILPSPYYFNQQMAAVMLGVRPVLVDTDPQTRQLDPDAIRDSITPRTRAVVTVSPNNPCGVIYADATLEAVTAICRDHDLFHVHDHAYEYFYFGPARPLTPAALPGAEAHTIALFSLSKSFAMAGWRIGYMVIPERLFEAVRKAQDTNLICPTRLVQHAAAAAMTTDGGYCRERVAQFAQRRDAVLGTLAGVAAPIVPSPADGAFYIFVRLPGDTDDLALAERLAREYGVAVVPGSAFGPAGAGCLRVSYGGLDPDRQPVALERLGRGLSELLQAVS